MYTAQTALTAWGLDNEGTDSREAICRRPCRCVDPQTGPGICCEDGPESMPTTDVEGHHTSTTALLAPLLLHKQVRTNAMLME